MHSFPFISVLEVQNISDNSLSATIVGMPSLPAPPWDSSGWSFAPTSDVTAQHPTTCDAATPAVISLDAAKAACRQNGRCTGFLFSLLWLKAATTTAPPDPWGASIGRVWWYKADGEQKQKHGLVGPPDTTNGLSPQLSGEYTRREQSGHLSSSSSSSSSFSSYPASPRSSLPHASAPRCAPGFVNRRHGTWVAINEHDRDDGIVYHHAFPCCDGPYSHRYTLFTDGVLVPAPAACRSIPSRAHVGGGCGSQARARVERACVDGDVALAHEHWTWTPNECTLPAWDAASFCRALDGRRILFVGDSTMHQTASTLRALVWEAVRREGSGNASASTTASSQAKAQLVQCVDHIDFALSDTLVRHNFGVMNRGEYWLEPVARFKPDIVVVSVGAHLHPRFIASDVPSSGRGGGEELVGRRGGERGEVRVQVHGEDESLSSDPVALFRSIVGRILRGWHKIHRQLVKRGKLSTRTTARSYTYRPVLVWKTISPGHDDCFKYASPGTNANSTKFNWAYFELYDTIARAMFEDEGNATVSDAF